MTEGIELARVRKKWAEERENERRREQRRGFGNTGSGKERKCRILGTKMEI